MEDLFRTDDFFLLKSKYFKQDSYFNPAQSKDSDISDHGLLKGKLHQIKDFSSYNNDPTASGILAKKKISNLLLELDSIDIHEQEISITPSITSSSFITIKVLQELGVKKIWVETPCYYATLFQAQLLGMKIEYIPSYINNNFNWEVPEIKKNEAIWITQPRISITKDQNKALLKKLFSLSKIKQFFIVIDEATELNTPSLISQLSDDTHKNIIRLRSVYKPLSINGSRIAYIIHCEDFKQIFQKWVWTFHGGIDVFSINSIPSGISEINQYKNLLSATKYKAKKAFSLLKTNFIGSDFKLIDYENGYTTCLVIKLKNSKHKTFETERKKLILKLEKSGIIPTLGPSMYFAHDFIHEYIRLNLFTNIDKLISTFNIYGDNS